MLQDFFVEPKQSSRNRHRERTSEKYTNYKMSTKPATLRAPRKQPTLKAHLKPQQMASTRGRSQSRERAKRGSRKPINHSPKLAARFYSKHKEEFVGLDSKALARKRFQRAILSVRSMVRFTMGFKITKRREEELKNMKLENTYRTEPVKGTGFNADKVNNLVSGILEEHLGNYHYEKSTAPKMARAMSSVISDKVKELKFQRYKFICNVIVGENLGQGFGFCSRGLWDTNTDSCSTSNIQRNNAFAVATVHGVYFE